MLPLKELIHFLVEYHVPYQNNLKKLWASSRSINFPQELSENIAIHIIRNVLGTDVRWAKNSKPKISGDAYIPHTHAHVQLKILKNKKVRMKLSWSGIKKIEIKCFTSDGPVSFGPTEEWDILYFLDAKDYANHMFKLYEVKHSNISELWKNLNINTTQKISDQNVEKRRPRIEFDKIKNQLGDECKLIWSGDIRELKIHNSL